MEVQLHVLLDSVLDGNNWSASRKGLFVTGEKAADSDSIGGLRGSECQSERFREERNIFFPLTRTKLLFLDYTESSLVTTMVLPLQGVSQIISSMRRPDWVCLL